MDSLVNQDQKVKKVKKEKKGQWALVDLQDQWATQELQGHLV